MRPKPYPSDMTDVRWAILQAQLPPAQICGRPRKTDLREVVNAIFYRNRNGCTWRALPRDFSPWRSVYNYFVRWTADGWASYTELPLRETTLDLWVAALPTEIMRPGADRLCLHVTKDRRGIAMASANLSLSASAASAGVAVAAMAT